MDNVFAHSIFPEFALIRLVAEVAGVLTALASRRLWSADALLPLRRQGERAKLVRRAPKLAAALGVAAIAGLWCVVYARLATSQHMALGTHGYDLGIFDQVIWNTANGLPFASSRCPSHRTRLTDEDFMILHRGPYTVPNPVSYTLGDDIELVGYETERSTDRLHLKLLWPATRRVGQNYTVFNHLVRPMGANRPSATASRSRPCGSNDNPDALF